MTAAARALGLFLEACFFLAVVAPRAFEFFVGLGLLVAMFGVAPEA
jgi:hypothetical protein